MEPTDEELTKRAKEAWGNISLAAKHITWKIKKDTEKKTGKAAYTSPYSIGTGRNKQTKRR